MASAAKKKVRKYSAEYLKFGFIPFPPDERLPQCLICERTLCNDSLKPSKLAAHLESAHAEHADKKLDYFQNLKDVYFKKKQQKSLSSMFASQSCRNQSGVLASYEISLLIARCGKPHTIGEDLVKPALAIFAKTVLGRNDNPASGVPLSNSSVQRRIDEMATDVEAQLTDKLRDRKFSVQLDESTVSGSQTLLLAYVRYIDKGEFAEEMLFCEELPTTTCAADIYQIFTDYFSKKSIPLSNIVSCAADGAPAMMGRHHGFLQLLKQDNPSILVVHCMIHREHLAAKSISPVLHEILTAVIKCVNFIKASTKNERLFKQFCLDTDEEYQRLLFRTNVRWLSKGQCLERFFELYDALLVFCGEVIDPLRSPDGKVLLAYLADIFGKLNFLNTSLQGFFKTLIDCRTKILSFIAKLSHWRAQIVRNDFTCFARLSQLQPSESSIEHITDHLRQLASDFESRFTDLKDINFPAWVLQPFLVELDDVPQEFHDELTDLQQDPSAEAIFKCKGQLFWLHDELHRKYPGLTSVACRLLLPFPSTYLVECAFSAVTDILTKKRNKLDVFARGDIRLKLTQIQPRIQALASQHQVQ